MLSARLGHNTGITGTLCFERRSAELIKKNTDRGWQRCSESLLMLQMKVAHALASLGVEFSEEVVEPLTGYRVDILLHGSNCILEVKSAAASAAEFVFCCCS